MKTEAEIRVMLLQIKKHLVPPGAGRDKEGSLLEPSKVAQPYQQLGFKLLASRTMREKKPNVLSYLICGTLLQ